MALTRTEIELLINARNNAQAAMTQLNDQVTKVTGSTQKANTEMGTFGEKTKNTGVAAGATGVAVGLLAEKLARSLVGAFQDTIGEANRLDAGLIGLGATAKAFGTDAGAAQKAAQALAADGLMNVGEAAAGLKNLLAGGFSLPQAIELMNRFKDSAAFGRQGSLEFGQAIVGATEGIKNGNSALVDNVGLTKNLSNILVEAGFSATDLSKVQGDLNVRTALYKGILKETNPQLGQTALYLETAAGKQAQFNSQVTIAQQQVGKALQPALASLTGTLTPLVQVVGENADTLVRLGGVLATVVIPMAALKASAAVGLTPALQAMTSATTGLIGAMGAGGGIKTLGDFRAGIQLAGESAGLTTKSLGAFGTAAAVAGAALIGWQIGRAIADLTGLDQKVQNLAASWMGYTAALKDQTAGAVQDTINRAIRDGAAATISYADAIKYNTAQAQIRIAVHDKSIGAQKLAIDAEQQLGRITAETAKARKDALDGEVQAQAVLANRMRMTDAVANAEKKYRDEIKATGYSQAELLKLLKDNEAGFDAYAKQVSLSDATIKRLKDTQKGAEDQQKKTNEATKKAAEEQKKLNEALEQTAGVVSQGTLVTKLAELQQLLDAAGKMSAPALATAVRNLWPEFDKLAQTAKDSGLQTDLVDAAFKRAAQSSGVLIANTRNLSSIVAQLPATISPASKALVDQAKQQIAATDQLNKAYSFFGINTPDQLRKAATAATDNYAVLQASGLATTDQLKDAYRKMIDAQKQATGELPGFWQTQVFPGISRTLDTLNTAVQGSFAQMLLGAKGFGDGFQDIWESIKSSVLNILNQILSAFIGNFLKGLIGAMSGQQGAFAKAFGGMIGGGGTGGIGSLLGLGGGGAALPGVAVGMPAIPGGAAAGGGGAAAGGIGALGGILGGAAAGGGGILMGLLGKQLFGGGGGKAAAFGAGTGFAQGALIGSVVPGLGTLIGGGIGAIAGALSGLFGKGAGRKKVEQFANSAEIGGFDQLQAKLVKLGDEGANLWVKLTQGVGKNDAKGAQAAIEAVAAALDKQAKSEADATKATEAKAVADQVAVDAAKAKLDQVNESMASLDEQTRKLNESEAPEEFMGAVEALARARIDAERKVLEEQKKAAEEALAAAQAAADATAEAYKNAAEDVQRAWDGVQFPDSGPGGRGSGGDGSSPTGLEGEAAGGVMANRPGLVIFGEGGETEVGGPASFFKRIFQELGAGGGGGFGGTVINMPVTINAMSGEDVKGAVDNTLVPAFVDALRRNVRGSLTNVQVLVNGGA